MIDKKMLMSLAPDETFEGFVNQQIYMVDSIIQYAPETIIDTGMGWGLSAVAWLEAYPFCEVYCLDPVPFGMYHKDQTAKAAQYLLNNERFHFINARCEDIGKYPVPQDVDLIFLDADHGYPSSLFQMRILWPYIKNAKLFTGHDARNRNIQRALSEFCSEYGLTPTIYSPDFKESKEGDKIGFDKEGWWTIEKPKDYELKVIGDYTPSTDDFIMIHERMIQNNADRCPDCGYRISFNAAYRRFFCVKCGKFLNLRLTHKENDDETST